MYSAWATYRGQLQPYLHIRRVAPLRTIGYSRVGSDQVYMYLLHCLYYIYGISYRNIIYLAYRNRPRVSLPSNTTMHSSKPRHLPFTGLFKPFSCLAAVLASCSDVRSLTHSRIKRSNEVRYSVLHNLSQPSWYYKKYLRCIDRGCIHFLYQSGRNGNRGTSLLDAAIASQRSLI